MFAQMLEKVGPLPSSTPPPVSKTTQKKQKLIDGDTRSVSARDQQYPYTSSKSEVGARIPDDDLLTLQSQFDEVERQMNAQQNVPQVFQLELQMMQTEDDRSTPYTAAPKSAKLRKDAKVGIGSKSQRGGRKVFAMGGTGGFNESGLMSSE